MTFQRLLALAGILALLLVAALLVRKKEAPVGLSASPLADLKAEEITRIHVVGVGSMTLINDGGVWRQTSPVPDLAQSQAVESLLTTLQEFTFGSVVSEKADRHEQFGLNAASATRVSVFAKGSETPTLDLFVGKPTTSGSGSFVRDPESVEVRTADGFPPGIVTNLDGYRESAVVPLAIGAIDGLSATWKGGSVALAKSSGTWTNAVNGKPVSDERVGAALTSISALRASTFTERQPQERSEFELGVGSGTARINVSFGAIEKTPDGNAVRRIYVGGRPSVMLVPEPDPTDLIALLRSLR